MSIQYKFFIISTKDNEEPETELNRFLRSVRVSNIQREFVAQGDNSFWSIVVEFLPGIKSSGEVDKQKKGKIDYKELLSPDDFSLYVKLREWRKKVAADESVPVYTIFTNEQLAKIAEKRIVDRVDFKEIEGIGESRVAKYAEAVIQIVNKTIQTVEQKMEEDNEKDRKHLLSDPDI